jgi:ribosome-binding factor A
LIRNDDSAGHRHQRMETSILEELASILRDDVTDPDLEGVRLTAVVLSPDYRNARVHFAVTRPRGATGASERSERESVIPRAPNERRVAVLRAFARAAPFLRGRLVEAIEMKRTPDLRFVYDSEIEL